MIKKRVSSISQILVFLDQQSEVFESTVLGWNFPGRLGEKGTETFTAFSCESQPFDVILFAPLVAFDCRC